MTVAVFPQVTKWRAQQSSEEGDRELSETYNTVQNDRPINKLQAQLNEALVTM